MKKLILSILLLVSCGLVFAAEKTTLLNRLPQKDIYNQAIQYDKKLYLVDVWATWCPPCRQTIPELIKLQQKYPTKNFTVIGLSVDSGGIAVVKDFAKEAKINYPVAMAGDALNYLPTVRGIPTLFLIDRQGKIVAQFIGYTGQATLAKAVDAALSVKN